MKIIGIKVGTRDQGEFVLGALKSAVEAKKVTLDDIAMVTRDAEGKLEIKQTKDITVRKGVKRGTLVGAVVGLAAPPLLGAAVVGAGIGALWGKFRDRGIDDDLMKNVGGMIAGDEAVVFALGDEASIKAIEERAHELDIGEVTTMTVNADDEALVREAAVHVPEPSGLTVRMPYS